MLKEIKFQKQIFEITVKNLKTNKSASMIFQRRLLFGVSVKLKNIKTLNMTYVLISAKK